MNTFVLVFDAETTGIPDWKTPSGSDDQPHLVQLAARLIDTENRKVVSSMNVIIKPDCWEIPQEVVDIHGITTEYANDVGIPEKQALEMFLALWSTAILRIAHNTTFDNRIIRIATKRYSTEEVQCAWKDGEYYCTMINAKKVMGGKNPTLQEAYAHFVGGQIEGAHDAMVDAKACEEIYFALLGANNPVAAAGQQSTGDGISLV